MTIVKVRLVRALVFSVALYGCEAWTLNKDLQGRVNAFEFWCWRRLLHVSWRDKRTNVYIWEEIGGGTSLEIKALKMKLSYFGHVVRSEGLEKTVMLGMGGGSRGRGRPRRRWMDEICEVTNLNLSRLMIVAREIDGWRELVKVVTRDRNRPDGTR